MDWSKPALTDAYATFLQSLKDRDVEANALFEGSTATNLTTGAKGWDAVNYKFIKWNGTSWVDLAATYGINVLTVGGYTPGNASGNVPVSNGVVNTNLNADLLDGAHAGTAANNVLKLDANGRALTANLPLSGATAGTYRSVTVNVQGQVTAGSNPTTKAGYGITDMPNNSGDSATGTWAISVSGNAATASACSGNAATAAAWQTARTLTLGNGLRGSVSISGAADITLNAQLAMGAASTTGTLDWNNAANTLAGFGPTLLMGNATNGPGPAAYHHVMNVEYSTKDGSGNVLQYAMPYDLSGTGDMFMRTRVSGVWSAWERIMSSSNIGGYAPSLTGTGASGTWGISISGNAATATNATNATNAVNASKLNASGSIEGGVTVKGNLAFNAGYALSWSGYGGSIWMQDPNWIRLNKDTYFNDKVLRTDGQLQVGSAGSSFLVTAAGAVTAAGSMKANGQLFGNGGTKGFGKVTTTTTSGIPTGGSDGDFVFVY